MSYTDLIVSNMSLDQVKSGPISSLSDASKAARKCKELLPIAKKIVLEATEWGFNERRVALAIVTGVDPSLVSKYTYAYQYPSDCLIAQKIYNESSESVELDFILQTNAAKSDIHLYTNKEDAILIYTAITTSYSVMRAAILIKAIVYELASQLCMPLVGDKELKKDLINEAFGYLSQAKNKDAKERRDNSDNSDQYIDAEA